MRSPSAKVLKNTCNIFVAAAGRDAEGGVQFPYPPTPAFANVSCSIQPKATEVFDEQKRITQLTVYHIIFGQVYPLNPRDMIQYTDASGVLRTIFVESIEDQAGRGAAFRVYAQERL
jgi:hypothetical protein